MPIAPYLLLLVAAATRGVAFVHDDRCPASRLLALGAAACAVLALCFRNDFGLWVTLPCVLVHVLVPLVTERFEWRVRVRLMLLAALPLPFLLPPSVLPMPRESWEGLFHFLRTVPVGKKLFTELEPQFLLAHTTGLVLCLSDCNGTLRALLRALDVSPPPPFDEPIDPSKYLRGGLVGAVERLLIYVFAANMAFNAIAFVITVKGIVRYQEIVKHHSAEYVLIGSLLSTLLAMLLGMLFARVTCA